MNLKQFVIMLKSKNPFFIITWLSRRTSVIFHPFLLYFPLFSMRHYYKCAHDININGERGAIIHGSPTYPPRLPSPCSSLFPPPPPTPRENRLDSTIYFNLNQQLKEYTIPFRARISTEKNSSLRRKCIYTQKVYTIENIGMKCP